MTSGEFKQKIYTLPGASLPTPDEVFSFASSPEMGKSSSTYSDEGPTDNATKDPHGRLISEHFDAPYIDEVANLSDTMRQQLFQLVWEPRQKTRLERSTMEAAMIRVCRGHFVSISALANIARRDEQSIRQQYLKRLVEEGKLRLAFPQYKTHLRQGYIAAPEHSTPTPPGSS